MNRQTVTAMAKDMGEIYRPTRRYFEDVELLGTRDDPIIRISIKPRTVDPVKTVAEDFILAAQGLPTRDLDQDLWEYNPDQEAFGNIGIMPLSPRNGEPVISRVVMNLTSVEEGYVRLFAASIEGKYSNVIRSFAENLKAHLRN